MAEPLTAQIDAALSGVVNARTGKSVIASGMVRDVATTRDGKVVFTILLTATDDAALVRSARKAVEAIPA